MQYKLKRKPTLMPAIALSALAAVVAFPALSEQLNAAAPQRFTAIVVRPGENLWTIADRYTPNGGNVQDTIDAIMGANALSSSAISPGEHLKIPR